MLEVVLHFIDRLIPEQSFTLVGHSYAGYLARGIIHHRQQRVNGLFLLVPWIRYSWTQRNLISGYRDQWEILENFPRATYAVLDRAGHRLQMEEEVLFNALVREWLDRVEESEALLPQ